MTRVALTLLACTASAPAAAQSLPKPSVVDLGVKPGQTVNVLTTDGYLDGTVVSVGATGLVLRTRTRLTTLPVESIRLIDAEFNDSVANGALWGFVAGGALGGLALSGCHEPSDSLGPSCSAIGVVLVAGGAGIGAVVGILVDLSKTTRRIVYRGPSRLSVSVVPVLTPRVTGFRAQLRW